MTDPIADMLNRIRNAQAVFHDTVAIPFSKFKYEIIKVLEKEGFIKKSEIKSKETRKIIEITLKYSTVDSGKTKSQPIPAISGLKRISRSGQRIYAGSNELKSVRGGYGIAIISASKGIVTNKEARKKNIGGEIICEIW